MTQSDRPFRSKEELEQELALQAKYRKLGNPEVVAALRHQHQQADGDGPTGNAEQFASDRSASQQF